MGPRPNNTRPTHLVNGVREFLGGEAMCGTYDASLMPYLSTQNETIITTTRLTSSK